MNIYIIAPAKGISHYITITEAGLDCGLAVKWTRKGNGWKASIKHIAELEESEERYLPVQMEDVDMDALQAITRTQ